MDGVNETLEVSAPEPIVGTEQPVEPQTVETTGDEVTSNEPVAEAPVTSEPKLYAGKYKSVEELERAYQNTSAESSRMAQELARSTKTETTSETETPKYAPSQLEDWKEGRLVELSNAQLAASKAYQEGNYEQARQLEATAKEHARQVRLIDAELRKLDIQSVLGNQSKVSAEQKLVNEATSVLRQFGNDLLPGSDLYTRASDYLDSYKAMGMDVKSPLVQAQAVTLAAHALGLSAKSVATTTRKEMAKTMTTALKQGVVAGAGKAASGSGQPDFLTMSDKEFRAYKAKRGW